MKNKYAAKTLAEILNGIVDESFDGSLAISVVVKEENSAPTDILLSNDEILSGSVPGTVVGILTAQDENADDTHTFEITSDPDSKFTIVVSGGVVNLVLENTVDFDVSETHSVSIKVTDSGGLTFSKDFTINVISAFTDTKELELDGINDFVTNGNDSSLNFDKTDSFSISFWLKMNDITSFRMILAKRDTSFVGYEIRVRQTSGFITFILGGSNVDFIRKDYEVNVADDVKRNFIFTYNGSVSAAGVLGYVNGVNVPLATVTDALTLTTLNVDNFILGSRRGVDLFYKGRIDQYSVWNKALTGAEATELFNFGEEADLNDHSASANLVMHIPIKDDDVFPVLSDNSVNANDGTMSNMDAGDIVDR